MAKHELVPIRDVQLWMVEQIGAEYVFGAEVAIPPPDHVEALDCSEYLQAACAAAGVRPAFPDGAYAQWRACVRSGLAIPVATALKLNGAVLFVGDLIGSGRDAVTHVAMSLGDNDHTIEARGRRWRVGIFDRARARPWSAAGIIPGTDVGLRF